MLIKVECCWPSIMRHNVGSYTQGRTAGDLALADFQFLSSREAARAERCPQKTTAAELAG
jgi:hypothetical protein